jgi:hypothetical protein
MAAVAVRPGLVGDAGLCLAGSLNAWGRQPARLVLKGEARGALYADTPLRLVHGCRRRRAWTRTGSAAICVPPS